MSTQTGIFVVDFLSDSIDAGTGFLAKYEAIPKTFWDMYIVVGLSSSAMLACVCCFCCWMRCKPEEREGRQIENTFGIDLQSTERGASRSAIKKLPQFVFTETHLDIMNDIGQSPTCTICLGDYEDKEILRLLPCGHCFHAECVDAWLQINRVCPICKVDVYDLLVQEEKRKKELTKVKKKKKRSRKLKKKKTRNGGQRNMKNANHVMPIVKGRIPSSFKTKQASNDENEVLTPMEQFRKRSRRLLDVGTVPSKLVVKATSAGEEKDFFPEIEMSVLPRVDADHQRSQNSNLPARPLPPLLQHSFGGSRDSMRRPSLVVNSLEREQTPSGRLRLPSLNGSLRLANSRQLGQNINPRIPSLNSWTRNSVSLQNQPPRANFPARTRNTLGVNRPNLGSISRHEGKSEALNLPTLITRFREQQGQRQGQSQQQGPQYRRRSTIRDSDTLLESTF